MSTMKLSKTDQALLLVLDLTGNQTLDELHGRGALAQSKSQLASRLTKLETAGYITSAALQHRPRIYALTDEGRTALLRR